MATHTISLPDYRRIPAAILNRVRAIGEDLYLRIPKLSAVPARTIIIAVIGLLALSNALRAAMPYALNIIDYTPLMSTLFNALALLDNFGIVLLFTALWLTKFTRDGGANEMKADLTWLAIGIVVKNLAWHVATIISASVLVDFSRMAPYLNWVWMWSIIYGALLYLIISRGESYVRSNKVVPSNRSKTK